jgi:hypothetical protein
MVYVMSYVTYVMNLMCDGHPICLCLEPNVCWTTFIHLLVQILCVG